MHANKWSGFGCQPSAVSTRYRRVLIIGAKRTGFKRPLNALAILSDIAAGWPRLKWFLPSALTAWFQPGVPMDKPRPVPPVAPASLSLLARPSERAWPTDQRPVWPFRVRSAAAPGMQAAKRPGL